MEICTNNQQNDQIEEMIQQGHTQEEVAEKTGIPQQTVSRRIKSSTQNDTDDKMGKKEQPPKHAKVR